MLDQFNLNERALLSFQTIENHFKHVKDYRRPGSVKHRLLHILFFTLCAVTAGANDLVGIHTWIEANRPWLCELFKLKHGTPSLSTLRITYMLLDPVSLSECFAKWVKDMIGKGNLKGICIDGKAQRGTTLVDKPNSFVHIVSAWATGHGLTLGQQKVDGKSNEITAIPELLDLIDVKGAVVTIDAMGTQKKIAEKIIDKEGDYILALKGNQSTLSNEVENFFDQAIKYGDPGIDFHKFKMEGREKGRHEVRKIYTATDAVFMEGHKRHWKGMTTIICVESEVTKRDINKKERRYYISSLEKPPEEIGILIREHWGIESTHWVLDVAFREDNLTARAGNITENLSLVRRISLNYLAKEQSVKLGTANKRLKAAYDKKYLLKVLGVKSFS